MKRRRRQPRAPAKKVIVPAFTSSFTNFPLMIPTSFTLITLKMGMITDFKIALPLSRLKVFIMNVGTQSVIPSRRAPWQIIARAIKIKPDIRRALKLNVFCFFSPFLPYAA